MKEGLCDRSNAPSVSAISRLMKGRDEDSVKVEKGQPNSIYQLYHNLSFCKCKFMHQIIRQPVSWTYSKWMKSIGSSTIQAITTIEDPSLPLENCCYQSVFNKKNVHLIKRSKMLFHITENIRWKCWPTSDLNYWRIRHLIDWITNWNIEQFHLRSRNSFESTWDHKSH